MNLPQVRWTIRSAFHFAPALLILAGLAETGVAADNPERGNLKSEAIEEIVVTGTRLTQENLASATPVIVLDTAAIERSGETNVAEFLRTLPASGEPRHTTTNSNFNLPGRWALNTFQLRHLGEDRTLTLVNGRRFVAALPGAQSVDFNVIPMALIDHIDVLTGGASAVYGSDAVAGVVNIVTKTDFEGVQLSAQGGISEYDDDESYSFSVTAGLPFLDERGHAMFSYTFDKEGGVFARNREGLEIDGANLAYFTGDAADWQESFIPYYSTYSEYGRFNIPNGGSWVFDGSSTIPYATSQHGFNRQPLRTLSLPMERNVLNALMRFDLSDSVDLYMESTYAHIEATSELESVALESSDIYGGQLAQCDNVTLTCYFGIRGDNPYIPDDMLRQMRSANPGIADEDLAVGFARRTTELGNRGGTDLRETFRLVMGVDGELPNGFSYDLHVNWGRTTIAARANGAVNFPNMRQALDAIVDPATGEVVCRDPLARLDGCVPVNLFGKGSMTAGLDESTRNSLLGYLTTPSIYSVELEQQIISGFISGDLFSVGTDKARFVIGAEYRRESSEEVHDAMWQYALGGEIRPTDLIGRYDVAEAFFEFQMPLFGEPGTAGSVDVMLSGRLSDYSDAGRTSAYAVSTMFMPHDDWMVRGQYAHAVRAPNIGELFEPLTVTDSSTDWLDPCVGVTVDPGSGEAAFLNIRVDLENPDNVLNSGVDPATIGDITAATCLADPTIEARVGATGGFALNPGEEIGRLFSGGAIAGGIALEPEAADIISAGFVWTPERFDTLAISLDWYLAEVDGGIGGLNGVVAIDNCYGAEGFTPNSVFCSGHERWDSGPSIGALRYMYVFTHNLAFETVEGIDLQASYGFDLPGSAGDIDINLSYSYLTQHERTDFEGATPREFVGELRAPRHKALAGLTYSRRSLQVAWTTQWTGDAKLSNYGFWSGANVGDRYFHDLQGRFAMKDSMTLYFGVDNVTDEYVTIGLGGPYTVPGWNTAPSIYDAIGRRYYVGLRWDL